MHLWMKIRNPKANLLFMWLYIYGWKLGAPKQIFFHMADYFHRWYLVAPKICLLWCVTDLTFMDGCLGPFSWMKNDLLLLSLAANGQTLRPTRYPHPISIPSLEIRWPFCALCFRRLFGLLLLFLRVCVFGLSLCSGVLKLFAGPVGLQSDTRILGPTLFVSLTWRDFFRAPKWSGSLQLFLLCAVW